MADEHISREAAIKVIQDIINHSHECYVSNARAETAEWCLKKLKELPVADVAEVRHGHWCMLSYDEAVCTCCGYNRNTPFESTKEAKEKWNELPPFCEMCGAKMDESEDDNG